VLIFNETLFSPLKLGLRLPQGTPEWNYGAAPIPITWLINPKVFGSISQSASKANIPEMDE